MGNNYYNAISALIEYQKANTATPWLFFLTSRVGSDTVNAETMTKLLSCIHENCVANADFSQQLNKILLLNPPLIEKALEDLTGLDHSNFLKTFGLGLGKWLLKLVTSSAPQWKMEMLGSYCYRVDNTEPDMLSLAFRFELISEPVVDSTGISISQAEDLVSVSEMQLAMGLLHRMANLGDLDALLENDVDLKDKMVEKSAILLESARYPRSDYFAWLGVTEKNTEPDFVDSPRQTE